MNALPYSMSAWVRPTGGTAESGFMSQGIAGDTTSDFDGLYCNDAVCAVGSHSQGGANGAATHPTVPAINQWHHVVATFASISNRQIFLDGVAGPIDTTTITRVTGFATVFLGTTISLNTGAGELAEAAVWDGVLTPAEISMLALGVSPLLLARAGNLRNYWPLINQTPEPTLMSSTTVDQSAYAVGGAIAYAPHPRIIRASRGIEHYKSLSFYIIGGITKSASGAALPGCAVKLYRTSDDVMVASTVSNASGQYSFSVTSPSTLFYCRAYKTGSPDLAGTTLNTLVGI
jgi:hypothetical protein